MDEMEQHEMMQQLKRATFTEVPTDHPHIRQVEVTFAAAAPECTLCESAPAVAFAVVPANSYSWAYVCEVCHDEEGCAEPTSLPVGGALQPIIDALQELEG